MILLARTCAACRSALSSFHLLLHLAGGQRNVRAGGFEIDRGDGVVELRELRIERMVLDDLVDAHVPDSAHGTGMNVRTAARKDCGRKEQCQDEALTY